MQTNNQLSLAYLSVPGAHPIAHIEAAAEAGFDAVGLRTVAPLGLALNQIIGNKSLVREIRQACERTGICRRRGTINPYQSYRHRRNVPGVSCCCRTWMCIYAGCQ